MKKLSNNKLFVKSSEIQTAQDQFQNSLSETTYVNTRNIHSTIIRLDSIRVARRCDETVDKKRVYSCVLKKVVEGVQQPKKTQTP